jgi:hypothetical protein
MFLRIVAQIAIQAPIKVEKAAVAQLVEHLIRNEGVGGSSPFRGTILSG